MRHLLKVLLGLGTVVLIIVIVLFVRSMTKSSRQIDVAPIAIKTDRQERVAENLSQAIRFRTISSMKDPGLNREEFEKFHAWLKTAYPLIFKKLKVEALEDHALLITWAGSNADLDPVMMMAHQDVVPVALKTEDNWEAPPFAGVIKDGFVWGRGAWDDKGSMIAQLDAVESLLERGYQPKRTFILAYGADEEVSGERGAVQIARILRSRNIRPILILDEGMLILNDPGSFGTKKSVALIGVAEKGIASFRIRYKTDSGHSSIPPKETAIGVIAKIIQLLEDNPDPMRLSEITSEMLDVLAPENTGLQRLVFSNQGFFKPIIVRQMGKTRNGRALLHTTFAPTIISSGTKSNVLPAVAEAVVNFRLRPGESCNDLRVRILDLLEAYPKAQVFPEGDCSPPSHISPMHSDSYNVIAKTVRQIMPDVVVAPSLMVGASDSRHMTHISDHIYRFSPFIATPDDLKRFHGTNERISVENLNIMVAFYSQLIMNSDHSVLKRDLEERP